MLSFDDTGRGVTGRIQTDVTAANGVTETVTNYAGASLAAAYLVDRTVTAKKIDASRHFAQDRIAA